MSVFKINLQEFKIKSNLKNIDKTDKVINELEAEARRRKSTDEKTSKKLPQGKFHTNKLNFIEMLSSMCRGWRGKEGKSESHNACCKR